MCEQLAALRQAMSECAGRFDAALLPAPAALRVVEDAAAIEHMAATIKAMAAARVAETELWKREGDRSPAHQLARKTGTSVGQASDAIATGRRLPELAATKEAATRGELSPQQAAAISDAASADPGAEARLLGQAKRGSLGELRDECARTKAAALPDAEARRQKIHDERYLRDYIDGEGAWNLRAKDNPEVGARIMAALAPIVDRIFKKAGAEGRRESREAYAMDALAEAVAGDKTATPPAGPARPSTSSKVIARVDLTALLRGHPTEGELCELLGYGPVACSVIEEMLAAGGFLALILTKGTEVAGVVHLGRRPRAHQQTALEWLYPTCAVEGCSAVARLENDHREDWSKTHITLLELIDRLCIHHHDLKTLEGWSLVEGKGKRAFVPPDDRRHPKNANAPPSEAA